MVGQSTPEDLSKFLASRKLPFEIYCDPGNKTYRAYGLERGSLWQVTTSPKVLLKGAIAHAQGHMQTGIVGDAMQMPGSFVIVEGKIVYAHRGQMSSDLARPAELLTAATRSPSP